MATAVTTTTLTDQQKVAILLASLDEKVAASILQQLDPDVMAEVANTIRGLGVITGELRDKAIGECVRGIVQMGNVVQGDEKSVNSLLARAIGEKRAAAMLQDKAPPQHDAFVNLQGVQPEQMATVLEREQPSVVAVVLRYLPPEKSAEILKHLSTNMRKKAISHLCASNPPLPEAVTKIEEYLEAKVVKGKNARKMGEADKLEIVTGIIQGVERTIEEELLTAINDTDEKLANEIKDRLFTFDDLVQLSDVAIRRILQEIDTAALSVALRGAPMNVREKFFKNMSKRAAESLKEEMQFAQKMKLSEVNAKQKEIVNVVRSLESEGQISLGGGGKDEYV